MTETNTQTGSELVEEGKINASLNYRVLHGHLKWRPEILKDVAVSLYPCQTRYCIYHKILKIGPSKIITVIVLKLSLITMHQVCCKIGEAFAVQKLLTFLQ